MTVLDTLADQHRLTQRVVIIDVFRSSNTMIELLHRGATQILPLEAIEPARTLKREHPDWLLLAEREGKRLPNCDGDNSPNQPELPVQNRTVILTTSGGTRCLAAAGTERQIYIGSFANAQATIALLRQGGDSEVSFWAVGKKGEERAIEDTLCATYLEQLWNGKTPSFPELLPALLAGNGTSRLRELGQHDDLTYCTTLDSRTVVPQLTVIPSTTTGQPTLVALTAGPPRPTG